ncbi:Hypothetical protein GLP15_1352 [Giardia lamblia P15]|uniref:Uncharacterized protein n=1 Tax=Giardia intestinalis (strain P15) TaxID=658858 RepID=E1F840_GIAIA|nr:Hypothetical protein GLP15_1352 [Giardia lamblia P15]
MYVDLFGIPARLLVISLLGFAFALFQISITIVAVWAHFSGLRGRIETAKLIQARAQGILNYGVDDDNSEEPIMSVFYYSTAPFKKRSSSILLSLKILGWTSVAILIVEALLGMGSLIYYPSYTGNSVASFSPFLTVGEADTHTSVQLNWADTSHRGSNLLLYQGDDIPTSINKGTWVSYAPTIDSNISHVILRGLEAGKTYYYYIKYFSKSVLNSFTTGDPVDSQSKLLFFNGLKGMHSFGQGLMDAVGDSHNTLLVSIGGLASATIADWNKLLSPKGNLLSQFGLVAVGRGTSDVFASSDKYQNRLLKPVTFEAVVMLYQPKIRIAQELSEKFDSLLDTFPYSIRILYRSKDLPVFVSGAHYHFVRGPVLVIILDIVQDYYRASYMGCPDFTILSGEQILYLDEVLTKYSQEVHPEIRYRFITVHGELYQLYADIPCENSLAATLELLACRHNATAIIGRGSDGFTLHNRTEACSLLGYANGLLAVQLPDAGGLSAWGRSLLRSYIGDFFQYFKGRTKKQRWPAGIVRGPLDNLAYGSSTLLVAATGNIVLRVEVSTFSGSNAIQCELIAYDITTQKVVYKLPLV